MDDDSMANYRAMLKLIQQAFPPEYRIEAKFGMTQTGLSDRVKLYQTARRIRRADHEKNRSKA